ncbi:MAG: M20/M25/M40 family metallo-hydrolase [Actinomycetota bacterium]|nr:M20/M25/M40 family metallo-hydrolase [Actinomycetota bacterium]
MDAQTTGQVADLLSELIRNGCVNDGTLASGQELRSADLLTGWLEGPGLDLERFESAPGRTSVVARIEGTDPDAATLLLMGHTDVVPANADRWQRDPFGGELIDGEIWGRGAVDMLNLTSSMAVAVRNLARSSFRPRGTLIYLAVADEEALGSWGAEWLCREHPDAIRADYVLTEPGGVQMPTPAGVRLPVAAGEKGAYWVTLSVAGTAGHGSQPWHTDNALVTAAAVVTRLADYRPQADIHEAWRRFVVGAGLDATITDALLDPGRIDGALELLPPALARQAHACTHTTFAPTVAHGGVKTNVIPDRVDLDVDIRTLPGQTGPEVRAMLVDALGDLAERVTIGLTSDDPSTTSPLDTPLWDSLARVSATLLPETALIPSMTVGATDARFFRRLGATSYGFGILSERVSLETYASMFHGDDERVDLESLRLSTELWEATARDLLA